MKLLYELYDKYETLNDRIVFILDTYFCTELKDLVTAYNKIIDEYEVSDSKYLFIELRNIKCLIDKSKLMSKTHCDNDIPDLSLPKEEDGNVKKSCNEMNEAQEKQNTGEGAQQGSIPVENGRAVSSREMHSSSSGAHLDVASSKMGSFEAPPVDSPPSLTSKTIATTASVAAIIVPSYLVYKVNRIMIEKFNVTAYI
ncbi:VIR protein [Plasmodium vivax]|uniref:VIR protein n=1 Tax=Plasmodium vivax TaxID=5855 RepID=A0A1G4EB72_PLAVI|nr:VIR protein [Plasmodium vivax]